MKSTKLETERRVLEIQQWIIEGRAEYLIMQDIISTYAIGRRQAKTLLKRAFDSWHEATKREVEMQRNLKIDVLKRRMSLMEERHQKTPLGLRVLLAYDKHIDKLSGIIPEKTHLIKGDPEAPIVITNSEEREARIAELLRKAMEK